MPPLEISRPVAHVAQRISDSDQLRLIGPDSLVDEVAYLDDYLNFAHPFREGNGRTQREFFSQLLSESGRTMTWDGVSMTELHDACHQARTLSDLQPLKELIAGVLT